MLRSRSFGKLGKRASARTHLVLEGGLRMPERSAICQVINISRSGCCLHMDTPPRLGATVMIHMDRVDAFGHIIWVRSGRCGVQFEEALAPAALQRLHWIGEHGSTHERNSAQSATAIWR
jgi:PilZ domain